jgi:hypothetical protein
MSKPTGEALIVTGANGVRKATATVNTAVASVIKLDPAMAHNVFAAVAGPTDFTAVSATTDSPEAVANGTAVYCTAKAKTNVTAGGLLANLPKGVTALKVTMTKNGAGTDDVPTVAALGGRSQVRCVPVDASDVKTGITDYTAIALA